MLIRPVSTFVRDALSRHVLRNADTFAYNARGEVSFLRRGTENAEEAYSYDFIGNLLSSSVNAATNAYAANCVDQYTSVLRVSVPPRETVPRYDADGNMTHDGRFSYAYDAENRLVSVTSAMETNGALRVLNAYDYRSRRIRRVAQRLSVGVTPSAAQMPTDSAYFVPPMSMPIEHSLCSST